LSNFLASFRFYTALYSPMAPFGKTFAVLSLCLLCACAPGSDAIWDTLQKVRGVGAKEISGPLNPNFRYLRVLVAGRLTVLVLGEIEPHPQGPIEVWYSPSREAVRLQNGRLVGVTGVVTEWRGVRLPALESWSVLARSAEPRVWTRGRDVMPGYRFGVEDVLSLRVIAPPTDSLLKDVDPKRFTWFEEQHLPRRKDESVLPTARYAVDFSGGQERVVYGEQCVATDLCFSWQEWPVAVGLAAKR
jgi:hypothetical protein